MQKASRKPLTPAQQSKSVEMHRRSLRLFPPPKDGPDGATIKPLLGDLVNALNIDVHVLEKRLGLGDYALYQPEIARTTAVRVTRCLMAEYHRQVIRDALTPFASQRRFLARTLLCLPAEPLSELIRSGSILRPCNTAP